MSRNMLNLSIVDFQFAMLYCLSRPLRRAASENHAPV